MTARSSQRGEFDLIAWARERSTTGGHATIGIGDDCAGLRFPADKQVLVTTDMLMDGRHFRLMDTPARQIGFKALAVNLSDIAAMAGVPIAAVTAVALPKTDADRIFAELFAGMSELAGRFDVDLIGGDTNAWDGPLVISVTVLGEAAEPIRRNGARAGDAILVTGPLGGSLLGRHLRPSPRISEALTIAAGFPIHAMLDISDGLSSDLSHILEESGGLGAILDANSIPIHDDGLAMAAIDGRTPLDHALNDGEDFELCFTLDPADATRLMANPPAGVWLRQVGEITSHAGLRLRESDGSVQPLVRGGFDHLAS